MTSNAVHRIGKISIKLSAQRRAGLFPLMDKLSKQARETISTLLDQWWSERSGESTIRLDKISLDLGKVPSVSIISLLKNDLDTALRKSLQSYETNLLPDTKESGDHRDAFPDAFIFFITHGTLPWNVDAETFDLPSSFEKAIQSVSMAQWKKAMRYQSSRTRLINVLSEHHFLLLLQFLSPSIAKDWLETVKAAEEVLVSWFGANKRIEMTRLLRLTLVELVISADHASVDRLSRLWVIEYEKQLSAERLSAFLNFTHALKKTEEVEGSDRTESVYQEAVYEALAGSHDPLTSQDAGPLSPTKPLARNEYYISNAGLAILWTGLRNLFAERGLTINNQFANEAARQRAVLVLHYLCRGEQVCSEYELTFNKVLCGIDAEEPIDTTITIRDVEREIADALRKEVHEKWEAVRKLSEKELISNFFLRNGKLSRRENGWLLQVEAQTWDVLLDKLPWGIGIIKLPWMEQMIYTEW